MSSWIDKASWLGWFASGESAVSWFLGFLDSKVSMSVSSVLNSIVVCFLSVIQVDIQEFVFRILLSTCSLVQLVGQELSYLQGVISSQSILLGVIS
jgi:hypothetical protein